MMYGGFGMKRLVISAALIVMAVTMFAGVSAACVGKTLVVGTIKEPSMSVLGEMVSIIITERTGTTVVVKRFDDYESCYADARAGVVDIIIDFTGRCYVDELGNAPTDDAAKAFETVKAGYLVKNYVWLQPIGFMDDGSISPSGKQMPSEAVPVVRSEILEKFPALDRVLMKLAGKIKKEEVAKLVEDSGEDGAGENKKMGKLTRKFLKKKRMI
jgi:osmoprotectant transport system substrate-binding protein